MTISTTALASNVSELERLKVLHNGQKEKLTFSNAEFERRLADCVRSWQRRTWTPSC